MLTNSDSSFENVGDSNSNLELNLEISWCDLGYGSILKNALYRNGIYGYATESLIVLEDGTTYSPIELSDHWEAYINSKKFKPKTLIYNLVK